MKIPKHLTGAAKEFWQQNAKDMIADGRLTANTYSGFVLLCEIWKSYVDGQANGLDANKIVALSKQCQNMFGQYGMTPASRQRLKLDVKKAKSSAEVLKEIMEAHAVQDEENEDGEVREQPTA